MKILPCFLYSLEFGLVVGHCCTYVTGTLLIMGSNLISFLGLPLVWLVVWWLMWLVVWLAVK